MKNIFPSYYKDFICIADKCPDTCCDGWSIVIDSQSLARYKQTDGNFGKKLQSVITVDEDGDTVFRNVSGRCPFLLENGLCEMYISLGKDSLCKTCELFPRHITYFGARKETGLSLSCPEAARLIMQSENPITFEESEEDGQIEPNSIDPAVYFTLLKARKTAINILQNRKYPFEQRVIAFLRFSQKLQQAIRHGDAAPEEESGDYLPVEAKATRAKRAADKHFDDLLALEKLRPKWNETLLKAKNLSADSFADFLRSACAFEYEAEHFAVYLVFRYFLTAAYDGDIITKAKFTATAAITVSRIIAAVGYSEKANRVTAVQRWSREVEHSALNMQSLSRSIKKSRYYSPDNLINILSMNSKEKQT